MFRFGREGEHSQLAPARDVTLELHAPFSQPGGDEVPFTVAGIVAYSLPTRTTEGAILMSQADAREAFGVTEASLYALQPMRSVPPDTFRDAVADKAAAYSAEPLSAAGLSSELGRSLDRLIGLFDLLAVVAVVIGMYLASPPNLRMLTWSPMPCITEPAPRNSPALKKPWVSRWKIAKAAPTGPSPAASIM